MRFNILTGRGKGLIREAKELLETHEIAEEERESAKVCINWVGVNVKEFAMIEDICESMDKSSLEARMAAKTGNRELLRAKIGNLVGAANLLDEDVTKARQFVIKLKRRVDFLAKLKKIMLRDVEKAKKEAARV